MSKFRQKVMIALIMLLICRFGVPAQTASYESFMSKGDYKEAAKQIKIRLDEIYSQRVDGKRIPNDFVVFGAEKTRANVNRLYRERKAESFFIEENPELFSLHAAMGRCLLETKIYDDALNHLYQSLRFRKITYSGEDSVFYLISQVNKRSGSFKGYIDALETAYSINERQFDYSLELGKSLYRTSDRKRAIYHLERYAVSKGEALDDLSVYQMLAGLEEDVGRYLDSVKYYKLYLAKKPEDGFIHFALGHTAFKNTGDYALAEKELKEAIRILPESEIFRKGKSYEYIGDMKYSLLKWDPAIESYGESMRYQNEALKGIQSVEAEIAKIDGEIKTLKIALLKEKNYVQYNEYLLKEQERQELKTALKEKNYEYNKLDPGRVRWNLGDCYERLEKYDKAIEFYRQVISFNYRTNDAREKIVKLQLKIKRGY